MKKTVIFAALIALAACSTVNKERMISDMKQEVGKSRPGNCPSRWCACYLDNKLAAHGFKPRKSWRAVDFASYGQASGPSVGAIMVQRNHVGIVTGVCSDGSVEAVSGNQNNRVGIGCYQRSKILTFRKISD